MPDVDLHVLRDIESLGARTASLAGTLTELISEAEARLNANEGKLDAEVVTPGAVTLDSLKLSFRRHDKEPKWSIYVSTPIRLPMGLSFASSVPLVSAPLLVKVRATALISGLLEAIRDSQRKMIGQLEPAVMDLRSMIAQLRSAERQSQQDAIRASLKNVLSAKEGA